MKKTTIGIGHLLTAMQRYGFGQDEISHMRRYLLDHKANTDILSGVCFLDDYISKEWEDNICMVMD